MTSMDEARERVRGRLGRIGIWRRKKELDGDLALVLERSGFGAIWIGGTPEDDLAVAEELLDATESIVVATGIVNIWASDAEAAAASHLRLSRRHPGRFLLGIGTGHPESAGARAARPYSALVEYVDTLERAGVPAEEIVLAALGPRVLRLAGDRTLGAHPYLVTPEHTRRARELLGPGPLLAPEQRLVLTADPARAREIGRPSVANPYLGLVNYRNNLERLGFDESDLGGEGSDRLIDELVVSGDPAAIAARIGRHLDAGADHVALQVLTGHGEDAADAYRRLADALGLARG